MRWRRGALRPHQVQEVKKASATGWHMASVRNWVFPGLPASDERAPLA